MAFTRNRFDGYIEGRHIYNYVGRTQSDIDTLDERIELVEEILDIDDNGITNDPFWQEVWDMGICKTGINTTDTLWSDTNVCSTLEGMANYILQKSEKEKRREIKIYNDYELFQRAIKDQKLLKKHGEIVEYDEDEKPIVMFIDNKRNHKLSTKEFLQVGEDGKKYSEIDNYNQYKRYLMSLVYTGKDESKKEKSRLRREQLLNKIESRLKDSDSIRLKTTGDIYRIAKNMLSSVEDDMLNVKMLKDKVIRWKSPLKDTGNEIDWEYLDMFDPLHVKALLQVKHDIDLSDDVYIDRDELISNIELTDIQRDILNLWRMDMTQENIAKELNVTKVNIGKHLDKIVKKIIDAYEKEYEEKHYYLNVVKGKYKKCSKCGEIKLLQRFNRNSRRKDGLETFCRECQCK